MDPLLIFYDIHELIIQHFSYNIFRAYKVSKFWGDLVLENSKFAMKKIRLNVKESNCDEVINVLEQKSSEMNSDLLDILNTKRQYQNIKIYVDNGWDFIDQIVRNLSNFLIDVEVSSDIYVENLKIPKLKYLKLDNVLMDGLTSCSNRLNTLTVSLSGKEYWLKKESPNAIRKALSKNSSLESLDIRDSIANLIFENDISKEIDFKLKNLSILFSKSDTVDDVFINFRSFLTNQNELAYLSIKCPDVFTIQWTYQNLKLDFLKIEIYFESNPHAFTLPKNDSLKTLDLNISSNWQYTMSIKYALRVFITSSPKLEVLKIRMSSPLEIDDFRFLLFNSLHLKLLVQHADERIHTYHEIYEQIKQDHDNISPNVMLCNFVK